MKKGKQKEEKEDEETMPEEREAESIFGGIEAYREGLESHMTMDPSRQENPVTAEAGSVPLTDLQYDMVFLLLCQGESHESIAEVMCTEDDAIDHSELQRSLEKAELELAQAKKIEGKHGSHLTIDPARQEGPVTTEAGSAPMTDDQCDTVFDLVIQGQSHEMIMEIMGVGDGAIDRLQLEQVLKQAKFQVAQAGKTNGKHGSERLQTEIGTNEHDRKGRDSRRGQQL